MFTRHRPALIAVLLLVAPAAKSNVIACSTDHIVQEDQRIEFHPRADEVEPTFFEVRFPKLEGYEFKGASIQYKVGGEHASTLGAALAVVENGEYLYSEGGFELAGQEVAIVVEAKYSDGSLCDLVLSNTWKHNKSLKADAVNGAA